MNQEAKTLLAIGVATVLLLVGGVFLLTKSSPAHSLNPDDNHVIDESILIKSDSYKIGTDSAKVKVVEFGDYQCPACGQAYPVTKQILKDYSNKIEFVFRNYPLPQHLNAKISAEAAEAAGAQGKFWEMHDKLYETQNSWSDSTTPVDIYTGYAKDLGLNVDQFKSEITAGKYDARIAADQADGNSVAVNATPTFFINGKKYSGAITYSDMKQVIDTDLAAN